ncbi:MgtC/SapB family protein [Magnetospirillum molischianum]|uniref:Protein MgtC n=1 Tax=Magnetospirillum molischianum DSM 120 TaxID=1150626 RepID=H8FMS4_MAGML|nr:MgtC/SapB family protein [Magnetospirillum molischianum]CCG39662.1 MgtC/SapB transporter [Magnetospirillum molischianum DSM 120]
MTTQTLADIAVAYWSDRAVQDNLLASLTVVGALLLGLVVGYERTWNGRAAGMRTYGFVCMASAALTVVVGHPTSWYGGGAASGLVGDPTRVIQGVVTGIGFLCAGVIMKDGFTISGLTTAASIWTVSVIGVIVGIGFYATALVLTLLATFGMLALRWVERQLPSNHELAVKLRCAKGRALSEVELNHLIVEHGFTLIPESLSIEITAEWTEWHFLALSRHTGIPSIDRLATTLAALPGLEGFQISHAKN